MFDSKKTILVVGVLLENEDPARITQELVNRKKKIKELTAW